MDSNQIKRQIEELRKEIENANVEYYVEENSSMSDFDSDKKFRELVELEKKISRICILRISNSKSWRAAFRKFFSN